MLSPRRLAQLLSGRKPHPPLQICWHLTGQRKEADLELALRSRYLTPPQLRRSFIKCQESTPLPRQNDPQHDWHSPTGRAGHLTNDFFPAMTSVLAQHGVSANVKSNEAAPGAQPTVAGMMANIASSTGPSIVLSKVQSRVQNFMQSPYSKTKMAILLWLTWRVKEGQRHLKLRTLLLVTYTRTPLPHAIISPYSHKCPL